MIGYDPNFAGWKTSRSSSRNKSEGQALLQSIDLSGLHLAQVPAQLFSSFMPRKTLEGPLNAGNEPIPQRDARDKNQLPEFLLQERNCVAQRRRRKTRRERSLKKKEEVSSSEDSPRRRRTEENKHQVLELRPKESDKLGAASKSDKKDNKLIWKSLTVELENKLKERNQLKEETKEDPASFDGPKTLARPTSDPAPSSKGKKESAIVSEIPVAPPLPNFLLRRFIPDSPILFDLFSSSVNSPKLLDDKCGGEFSYEKDYSLVPSLTGSSTRRKRSLSGKETRDDPDSSDDSLTKVGSLEGETAKGEVTPFRKDFRYFSLPPIDFKTKVRHRSKRFSSSLICDLESDTDSTECFQSSLPVPQMLPRSRSFGVLKEVQLSHNRLTEFPDCLFPLPHLTKINLCWNRLKRLPERLSLFENLEILNVSHNLLLEVDVSSLKKLKSLDLGFNCLTKLPTVHKEKSNLTLLNVSSNQIWNVSIALTPETLPRKMKEHQESELTQNLETIPVVLNLNLNRLTGAVTLASFQHVTELDVSDNGITSLDVSTLASLTSLTCSNNDIVTVSLHGEAIQSFIADNNRISSIKVRNHPRQLEIFTIAKNCLGSVPPWLVSCSQLRHLDVSRNNLTSLPAYVTSGHLERVKYLAASHNQLEALSTSHRIPESSLTAVERQRKSNLEILLLHHNQIKKMAPTFFSNFPRLRVLNVSSNELQQIPDCSSSSDTPLEEPCLVLQEFYGANNLIKDLRPLEVCQSLRILYVPFNNIATIPESLCWSCGLLEEVVLSGNNIATLPASISRLSRLTVLKVHQNFIKSLPRLSHLDSLKVIDASHCNLGKVEFESVVGSSLSTLDVAANPSLVVDRQQFTNCRAQRSVNFVKTTNEKNDSSRPSYNSFHDTETELSDTEDRRPFYSSSDAMNKIRENNLQKTPTDLPWTIGFCESTGKNSELALGQLRIPDLEASGTIGLVALADGGDTAESVIKLFSLFPKALQKEKLCCPDLTDALKYSLLSCLREIVLAEHIVPDAFCSAYLETDGRQSGNFNRRSVRNTNTERPVGSTLRLCCFGDITAVVTSFDGPPLVVSSSPHRRQEGASEMCKMSGRCDMQSSLPDPHTTLIRLSHHHRSLVIASASLWEAVEPEEVNEVCQETEDPALAAKKLLTLAQSYGSRKPLSVLIASLPRGRLQNSYQYSSLGTRKLNCKPDTSHCSNQSPNRVRGKSDGFNQEPLITLNNAKNDQYVNSSSGCSDSDIIDTTQKTTDQIYANVVKLKGQSPSKPPQYYHFPPPSSNATCSCDNLPGPKLPPKGSSFPPSEFTYGIISPPEGFGNSDGESDSGFSGNSNGKFIDADTGKRSSQVSGELFRSMEHLAHNCKDLFLRELDSINGKSNASIASSSVPNLAMACSECESEDVASREEVRVKSSSQGHHFQRNILRKSRFARGAVKLLQSKFNSNTLKINESLQKMRPGANESFTFKRFGSLQNLKLYQPNRLWSTNASNGNISELESEMAERTSVDVLELESRMHHYWNTGVTCF